MNDPCHQEDAEIDKALGEDWPDKSQPRPLRFPLSRAEVKRLTDELAELRDDKARLDWLIKQGPPGAAPSIGLTEETWEIATAHAGDNDCETDAMAVRAAIDAARKAGA